MLGVLDEVASFSPDAWDPWAFAVRERSLGAVREESRDPLRRRSTRSAWKARNADRLRTYYAERYQRLKAERDAPPKRRGKLTAEQVEQVRALSGTASAREVGRRFGVGHETIGAIWSGKAWRQP